MFHRERRYANRTHPSKSTRWKASRYWGKLNPHRKENWVFGDKRTGLYLHRFSWYGIKRHILVKGTSSPDDPNLREYWRERNKTKAENLSPSHRKIARKQNGICLKCKESLFNGEELHIHHVTARKDGGKDTYDNLMLIHLYCHQQEHSKSKEGVE